MSDLEDKLKTYIVRQMEDAEVKAKKSYGLSQMIIYRGDRAAYNAYNNVLKHFVKLQLERNNAKDNKGQTGQKS